MELKFLANGRSDELSPVKFDFTVQVEFSFAASL